MARVEAGDIQPAPDTVRRLHAAIFRRHSNRFPFSPEPVPSAARAELIRAAANEAAWLDLLTGPVPVGLVGEIARAADRVLNRDESYREEVLALTSAGDRNDGVPASAGGPQAEPGTSFRSVRSRPASVTRATTLKPSRSWA